MSQILPFLFQAKLKFVARKILQEAVEQKEEEEEEEEKNQKKIMLKVVFNHLSYCSSCSNKLQMQLESIVEASHLLILLRKNYKLGEVYLVDEIKRPFLLSLRRSSSKSKGLSLRNKYHKNRRRKKRRNSKNCKRKKNKKRELQDKLPR